ncbi:unnamed protein product, partial [marine sediment metagenome]
MNESSERNSLHKKENKLSKRVVLKPVDIVFNIAIGQMAEKDTEETIIRNTFQKRFEEHDKKK